MRRPNSQQAELTTDSATPRPALIILLVATFLAFLNYAALLSVVPMWASSGGAAGLAVGSTTAVMMGATVATQCAAPLLFTLFRLRTMMIVGSVLLGAPTPLYAISTDMWPITALTIIRGVGFALVVIAGATLVADLAKSGRVSSTASLYGTAAALPNLAALAGGVWVAENWGFSPVFWVSGIACLIGATVSTMLPGDARGTFSMGALHDVRQLALPIGILLLTAAAFGAATTFLPISGPDTGHVSLALLLASAALIAGRLGAGVVGDRLAPGRLLLASVLLVAVGLALLSQGLHDAPAPLLLGAALIGAGFGVCQNDSFILTVQRLGPSRTGTASTLWNMAYDGGLGAGALALGWMIGTAGHAGGFLMMSIGIAAIALLTSWLEHRAN